jgi:hypothetical protein
MNSNRPVLRATENRLPLKDVTSKIEIINKTKLSTKTIFQQQENVTATVFTNKIPITSRPILTAVRSLKTKENEQPTEMLISPLVKTHLIQKQDVSLSNQQKTREQLEQDLYEL